MRVIDLSHPIEPEMTLYPGTEPPSFRRVREIATHGDNELSLTLTTHTGTHLDAPAHVIEGGATLDRIEASLFAGPGMVVDVRGSGPELGPDALKAHKAEIRDADFLLIRTGWEEKWKTPAYLTGFPALSLEAARLLAGLKLKGLGLDAISADRAGSGDLPVHHALLGAGLIIVENLRGLAGLPRTGFIFCCAPLNLAGADGSPVRAVAILDI